VHEILLLPNLLSLTRIALTPFIAYFLWKGGSQATFFCIALLIVAGITDGLDGYLARRLHQKSRLGTILDPLADKILVASVVVMLIFFRDLPVWLAMIIVGRDLLILAAGIVLLKRSNLVVPSNLTGKYTFAAIAFLLGSYIIKFDFGITLMTYLTVGFVAASIIIYAKSFVRRKRGLSPALFEDRLLYKIIRVFLTLCVALVFLYKLYLYLFS